jgi:predicted ATPase
VWLLADRDGDLGAELTGPDLSQHHHLQLRPLTTSDMAAIAQDRLGRVPDERVRGLLMAAAGNPFLAIELLNGITREDAQGQREQPESQTPVEFTAAIAHQFAQLTGPARELVRLVAVAGSPTTIQEAAALSPAEDGAEQALTEAVKSGLIMSRDGAVTFRHDLVRDAVYAAMPQGRHAACTCGSPNTT